MWARCETAVTSAWGYLSCDQSWQSELRMYVCVIAGGPEGHTFHGYNQANKLQQSMSPLRLVLVWRAVRLDNVWIDLVCKDSMLQLNVLLVEEGAQKKHKEKKSTNKVEY